MKKILLTIILLLPFFIFSQEINEAFLNSLPEDIQDDIKNRVEENDNQEPIYTSIQNQSELDKSELEDLRNRLEEDLELLKKKLDDDDTKLKIFGSDFFRTYQSTYMPVNEPNLSSSYVLDFGDSLEVQLIGQVDSIDTYQIKRDGTINIPDIGPVTLSGLNLENAISLIKAKVNSSFISTEAFISLKNVRDINVLVSGNAFRPGIYTLGGNSNMLHAIAVAGGINKYGSYRVIKLIRDNEVIETLDIYDILITGNYSSKIKLKSGDTIFVEPVKKLVAVDGAVKIPAKYELLDDQYLSKVIEYANGLSKDADLKNIYLDRVLDGTVKSLPIQNIKQFNNILANDGDTVYIRKFSFRSAVINGAVLKPGTYLMSEGETVDDLIQKSGGFTKDAYLLGAVYENEYALAINEMANQKLYESFIDNIITVSQKNPGANFGLGSVVQLTKELKESEPNGRVVIDLFDEKAMESLIIKDGDTLTIPEKSEHIYIYGEVSYEGALKFDYTKSLEFYINKSGGFKTTADEKAIYVLQPNGDTERVSISRNIFQNNPNKNIKLHPGSIIFVPRAIDDSATTRLAAQAYVSILGNIGIALASLSSINNN